MAFVKKNLGWWLKVGVGRGLMKEEDSIIGLKIP